MCLSFQLIFKMNGKPEGSMKLYCITFIYLKERQRSSIAWFTTQDSHVSGRDPTI